MRKMIESILPWIDFAVFSAVYPAAYFLKTIRKAGVGRMPLCRRALMVSVHAVCSGLEANG